MQLAVRNMADFEGDLFVVWDKNFVSVMDER